MVNVTRWKAFNGGNGDDKVQVCVVIHVIKMKGEVVLFYA